jgi:cytochrome c5
MNVLAKSMIFSVGLTLVFLLVTRLLPQVQGDAPVEQKVDLGSLTMDDFVALGEGIFMNKGTCTLCHKPPPLGRAPDIQGENLVEVAAERLADPRYQGKATTPEEYIHESMVDPNAYVVAGWGKKGSNDSESPMPKVDKPPIQLSPMEMDAIIAWLQAKDGNEVTVALPSPEAAAAVAATEPEAGAAAPAATGEEAIGRYGCQACHALLGSTASLGPALNNAGERLNREQIRQSIIDPNAVITEGFTPDMMPADFAERMTVRELEMIVNLLAEQKQ